MGRCGLRAGLVVPIPILLLFAGLRLVLTGWFCQWEYGRPGFPADSYGLTQADRRAYSSIVIGYVLGTVSRVQLRQARLSPQKTHTESMAGEDRQYLLNDRELRHMEEVRTAYRRGQLVASTAAVGWLLLMLLTVARGRISELQQALRTGAITTLGVLVVGGTVITLGFTQAFEVFHRILFGSVESSTFFYWDTLGRLFPEQFFHDAAVMASALAALGAGAIVLCGDLLKLCGRAAGAK